MSQRKPKRGGAGAGGLRAHLGQQSRTAKFSRLWHVWQSDLGPRAWPERSGAWSGRVRGGACSLGWGGDRPFGPQASSAPLGGSDRVGGAAGRRWYPERDSRSLQGRAALAGTRLGRWRTETGGMGLLAALGQGPTDLAGRTRPGAGTQRCTGGRPGALPSAFHLAPWSPCGASAALAGSPGNHFLGSFPPLYEAIRA